MASKCSQQSASVLWDSKRVISEPPLYVPVALKNLHDVHRRMFFWQQKAGAPSHHTTSQPSHATLLLNAACIHMDSKCFLHAQMRYIHDSCIAVRRVAFLGLNLASHMSKASRFQCAHLCMKPDKWRRCHTECTHADENAQNWTQTLQYIYT